MKKQIPNLITLCNLLSGTVASYFAIQGNLRIAALLICLGILFDFFDGLVARLLGVASPLGKELDSLADIVTSGVAPAFILFQILNIPICSCSPYFYLKYIALLIPPFAAYRLAKFNLDTRQSHSFLGLPVPSNALIWVGLALSIPSLPVGWIDSPISLILLTIISLITDILMISELPMFSLKFNFHQLDWHTNRIPYLFLIGCLIIIVGLHNWIALSAIILWYILLSAITQPKQHAK